MKVIKNIYTRRTSMVRRECAMCGEYLDYTSYFIVEFFDNSKDKILCPKCGVRLCKLLDTIPFERKNDA